ncbi:50S ribosomal protein L10 [Candidatus Pacearchaeota archaeon ex4484_26]|nr:MAG: 50S ribosomal protein L10 [Candidatus Pacearchaeota archaeon ex4484_26]
MEMKNQKSQGRKDIAPKKKKEIAELAKNVDKYDSLIITSINEMPALLLQKIRKDLKEKAVIKTTKRRILVKLFEELAKKDERYLKIEIFCKKLKDSCAIIFSNENIFSLIKILQKKQQQKKAKPGKSNEDITIKPGPTGLMAGPILTELADAGIKAGLEKGKVIIKEKFELKKGQIITESLAKAMEKLNILPITARLFPLVAYDKKADILFKSEQLEINLEQQLAKIKEAYKNAFSLVLKTKYFIKESTLLFLKQAYIGASCLMKEARIITKESIKDFLIEAHNQASLINKKI